MVVVAIIFGGNFGGDKLGFVAKFWWWWLWWLSFGEKRENVIFYII